MLRSYSRHVIAALKSELFRNESGQTMVEYVMLIVLVALAAFVLTPNIRDGIVKVFQNTSSVLS